MSQEAPIPGLPAGYHSRFAAIEDLPATTALYNICEIADSGVSDYSEEEVRSEWQELEIGRDVVLILGEDDQIAGAIQVGGYTGGAHLASGYVHPDHTGQGLGRALVEWSERRIQDDPPGEQGHRLVHLTNGANQAAGNLLVSTGFELEKNFVRMRIDLDGEPESPVLPEGFCLEAFSGEPDLEGFYSVVEEAFLDQWSIAPRTFENWKEAALGTGYDPNHWSQVFHGDERVGIAIGLNDFGEGWIRWVGVREKHRCVGIGKAMMLDQFARYWRAGVTRIGLGFDQTNLTDPGRLYERVGMSPVMVTALYVKTIGAESP